ncbi:MAG: hypothetical protein JWO90_2158 [Solirubrobacterales bacterium]|jgi:hypothetical protein|nr:hypothetical protein [Solirubrobacterales bacterium]
MLRRSAALALTLVAAFGATACGEENTESQQGELAAAESEALYVDLGGLKYQVQLSRQLNPRDAEDADYFRNLAPGEETLPKGQVWFGVFLRVENESKDTLPAAEEFDVEDTQKNAFEPVESENTFAYRAEDVPGGGYLPNPERLQSYAGTQGSLLLFKIPYASLDNRPLELAIKNPRDAGNIARIDLDV